MTYRRSLAKIPTKRLLAMRDRMYRINNGLTWLDGTRKSPEDMIDEETGMSLADIKTELAGREHIPNKPDRKKIRQEKAKRR